MSNVKAQEEYRKQRLITGIKIIHYLASVALFFLFWMLFRYDRVFPLINVGFRYNYYVAIGFAALLLFFNRTYNCYLIGYSRIRTLVFAQALSQLFSIVTLYCIVSFGWFRWINPLWFVAMMFAEAALDIGWSYYANWFYFRLNPAKKTILIYRNKLDKRRFGSIQGKPSERLYTITDELMYDGRFSDLKDKLVGYDAIFVAGVNSRCRNGILKYCKEENIPAFFLPHVGDVIMQESIHIQSFDSPVLYVTRSAPKPEYRVVKRAFDFCASLLGIIILSPIMLITALAIRLYDGGPALYKQIRLTYGGKQFKILNVFRELFQFALCNKPTNIAV